MQFRIFFNVQTAVNGQPRYGREARRAGVSTQILRGTRQLINQLSVTVRTRTNMIAVKQILGSTNRTPRDPVS